MAADPQITSRPPGVVARTLRALRHRNFRLFFVGQLVSLVGSWMQTLAQGWLVWRLSHSSFLLGLVGFFQMGPVLLLALVGGIVADRFNRHRIVIATQSAALVQSVALAALTLTGTVEVWHVMALAAVLGAINAFDMPGRQAFLVQMVGREDLGNAIALNSSVFNGARIVGPALAGIVVRLWGEGTCFLLNAVSYLAVLASLVAMRLPAHEPIRVVENAWGRTREGFRYAWQAPHVRTLLLMMTFSSFFGMSYTAFMPAFAGGVLDRGASGLGILMSFSGIGALTAAVVMASRQGVRGLGGVVPRMATGFGLCLLVFATSRNFALSCAAIAGLGYCMMMQMAATNTILQALVPDQLRGRLMSLYTLTFVGVSPIGSLAMGRLASSFGLQHIVAAGALAVLVAAALLSRPLSRAVTRASAAAHRAALQI